MLLIYLDLRKLLIFTFFFLMIGTQSNFAQNLSVCGEITCTNYVNLQYFPSVEWAETKWTLSGYLQEYGGYATIPALMVAVVDDSCGVWKTPDWQDPNPTSYCFGQFNGDPTICNGASFWRGRSESYFIFQTNNPVQMDSLTAMLTNKIPLNHWVLIYTYIPISSNGIYSIYDNWTTGLYNHFSTVGSDSIAPGKPDNGFIAFYKQGDTTTYQEVYGPPLDTVSQLLTFTSVISACQSSLLTFADTSFCSGLSSVITAVAGYDNYLWNTGDTSQSISVNQDTMYYLTTSQNFGCEMTDSVQVVLLNCTGIDEEINNTILVYPNPTTDNFIISSKSLVDKEVVIFIYSIDGKQVFYDKRQFTTVNEQVNVDLPKGIYQVVVSSTKGKELSKIIIGGS